MWATKAPTLRKLPRADDFGGFAPRAKEVAKVEALVVADDVKLELGSDLLIDLARKASHS
jgi:hypothetical protein